MNNTALIPYIIIIASLAGILAAYIAKRIQNRKQREKTSWLEDEKQEKLQTLRDLESRLSDLIKSGFDDKWANEVFSGFISNGMPTQLLKIAWGMPAISQKVNEHNKNYELWSYEPFSGANNQTEYRTTVKIQDNRIVEWV